MTPRSLVVPACLVATVALWLTSIGVAGQPPASRAGGSATDWIQPRTPWGDPDLQGVWEFDLTSTPMERPGSLRAGNS